MKRINDILGYNLKIAQDSDCFMFSLDSIILSNFSTFRMNDKRIIDLCTGNGVVPLVLSKRINKKIDCIEIQDKLYDLLLENIKINNLNDRINPIKGDVKTYFDDKYNNYYDVVLCNPPYFKDIDSSSKNLSEEKMIARHEIMLNFDELCLTVKKILKNNGSFFLIHRVDRLNEILNTLQKYNLMPKRMFFVHDSYNSEANMVFIESRLNGKEQLKVEKPFFVRNNDGSYTEEYTKLTKEVLK